MGKWDGTFFYTWSNQPQRQRLCLIGAVGADSCPPGSSFSSYQMPKVSGVQRHQLTFWQGSRTSDSAAAHIAPAAALPAKVLLPRHETVIYNVRRNSRTKLTKQHLIKSNKSVFSRKFKLLETVFSAACCSTAWTKEDVRTEECLTGLFSSGSHPKCSGIWC